MAWRAGLIGGVAAAVFTAALPAQFAAAQTGGSTPDLANAVHYLTTTTGANGVDGGTSLAVNGYYEAFDQFADFGLTIDGAFALAAAGTDNTTLAKVVHFFDSLGTDASGRTVNDWTGIGTEFASGGAVGKEALLAEVVGADPHSFGGQDLIAALDSLVCAGASPPPDTSCAGAGNYLYSTSTFSQALGIMAQLRAGDSAHAGAPITYLESLQNSAGAWPSLIPSSGDSDVDSTAMGAMALALLPGDATASAAVNRALGWLASQQQPDGGFLGAAGDSTNSAALAIMGMRLAGSQYATEIGKALAFLAGQQNSDGGFNVAAGGQPGSDVRASTQIVSGIVGTSFGTLSDDLGDQTGGGTPPPGGDSETVTATVPQTAGSFSWTINGTSHAVSMGDATNKGAYWESTGQLLPVTVTDTRGNGPTWSISGRLGDFTDANGVVVSGRYLGWTPQVTVAGAGAAAGAPVSPGLSSGNGLLDASTLASATAGHGSGSATVGAGLDLQVPATTAPGTYTATLTLTALS